MNFSYFQVEPESLLIRFEHHLHSALMPGRKTHLRQKFSEENRMDLFEERESRALNCFL